MAGPGCPQGCWCCRCSGCWWCSRAGYCGHPKPRSTADPFPASPAWFPVARLVPGSSPLLCCAPFTPSLPTPAAGKGCDRPPPRSMRLGAPGPFPLPPCPQGPAGSCAGHGVLGPVAAMPRDGGCMALCRDPGGCRSGGGSLVDVGPGHMAGGSWGVAGGESSGGDRLGRCSGLCSHVFAVVRSLLAPAWEQRVPGAACAAAAGLGTAGRPEEPGLASTWLNAGREPAAPCPRQPAAKGAFCKCSGVSEN